MPTSETRFSAFDVVAVPFPYSDQLAEKRRPAVVVSGERLPPGLVWVAMITSADNRAWPTDVPIADLRRAGLPAPSIVRPAKLACIDRSRILRRVGRLDKAAARVVAQRIRAFLA